MQEEVTQKTIALYVKVGKGAAYRTGVTESNPKVFGAEKQARAWETDHAAAYEAGSKHSKRVPICDFVIWAHPP